MNESMRKIETVKPVAPYLGGKSRLAKGIVPIIENIDHKTYAEPFVGMGGIFLRRKQVPKSEVINDYSKDVSNFFRILQRHYIAFLDMMKWQLTTRAEFDRLTAANPETLTDLERAARFLYLQRLAFGGKPSGRNFGVDPLRGGRFDITKLVPMLEDLHMRLTAVTVESLDYKAFIKRYDRPTTLFYLDPPYYGCEKDYGADLFTRDEFKKMAKLLKGIKGSFILSLNDHEDVRKIFKSFNQESVDTIYTVSGGQRATKAKELLISNRELFT